MEQKFFAMLRALSSTREMMSVEGYNWQYWVLVFWPTCLNWFQLSYFYLFSMITTMGMWGCVSFLNLCPHEASAVFHSPSNCCDVHCPISSLAKLNRNKLFYVWQRYYCSRQQRLRNNFSGILFQQTLKYSVKIQQWSSEFTLSTSPRIIDLGSFHITFVLLAFRTFSKLECHQDNTT